MGPPTNDVDSYRLDDHERRLRDLENGFISQRLMMARWSGVVIVVNALVTLIGLPSLLQLFR